MNVDLTHGVIVRAADSPVADAQAPFGFGPLQARDIALPSRGEPPESLVDAPSDLPIQTAHIPIRRSSPDDFPVHKPRSRRRSSSEIT